MYATKAEFEALYGTITEADYNRYAWEASRVMDINTSGVDGVTKLAFAFPTKERDAEAVKRCCCSLINLMRNMATAESAVSGFIVREDGTVVSKAVSSVSSGSESVSYAAVGAAYGGAVTDLAARDRMYAQIVRDSLRNVQDANGVNLLYMGCYPHV